MGIFGRLFAPDIAIDLGTANTLVFVKGHGIILSEPSVVAMDRRTKRVMSGGAEAKAMVGKTPANIIAVRPLKDGVIAYFDVVEKMMEHTGIDRMGAIHAAIDIVRRGGTVSLSGVYGGQADPMPMMMMFDKQIQLRMGQANVHRWVPEILPLLVDGDPLGVDGFATHHLPLDAAPEAYATFRAKKDGMVKTLLRPSTA